MNRIELDQMNYSTPAETLAQYHIILRDWLGFVLMSIGIMATVRAIAYIPGLSPEPLPFPIQLASKFIPIWLYIAGWAFAGVLCFWGVGKRNPRAPVGVVAMCLFWTTAYWCSFVFSFIPSMDTPPGARRDYMGGTIYGLVAILLITGRYFVSACLNLTSPVHPKKEPSET